MVFRILSDSFRKIALIILSAFVFNVAAAESLPASYTIRTVPDSVISKLQKKKEFAYANDPAYWKEEVQRDQLDWLNRLYIFATQQWIRMFIYILLGAALLFILYRLIIVNKRFLFYSSKKLSVAQEEENDSEDNLEEKIEHSVKVRDYRAAIRFMYLKALYLLDAKGWIQFNAKSTNRDYLNALHPYPLAQSFRVITRNYDYVWYGEFGLNEQQFTLLQKNFEQFYNSVSDKQ